MERDLAMNHIYQQSHPSLIQAISQSLKREVSAVLDRKRGSEEFMKNTNQHTIIRL